MTSTAAKPRVTSLAPQFLVDDLDRAIAWYRDALGFTFAEPWGGFYAIGKLDGLELHLKKSPRHPADRAPPRQRTSRRLRRRRWHRSVLPAVRPERRPHPQAAVPDAVGHEGLLRRGPRRPHHLLRRPPDRVTDVDSPPIFSRLGVRSGRSSGCDRPRATANKSQRFMRLCTASCQSRD